MNSSQRSDDVDYIIQAWREARPDFDLSPLAVFSRITRLHRYVDVVRRQAFSQSDLESWEFDVLSALRRAGEPYEMTPGMLLRQTLVTSGTMTTRIDKLVSKGLVNRRPDPSDGRGVRVRLCERGIEVVDKAMDSLIKAEQELLHELSAEQSQELAGILRILLTGFESNSPAQN